MGMGTTMPSYSQSIAKAILLGEKSENIIQRALKTIRRHLGMDIAYFSQIVDDKAVLHRIDAPGLEHIVKVGDAFPLEDIYCGHVLEGRLPELMPDTSAEPVAAAMPITRSFPAGANISIPVRLEDGSAYGMFCCVNREAKRSLNERDLEIMHVFADLVAEQVNDEVAHRLHENKRIACIEDIISEHRFHIIYQPIWAFRQAKPIGFEALCRFEAKPARTPDIWFKEANATGLGTDLELAAIGEAVRALPSFPGEAYLSFNASPTTVLDDRLGQHLNGLPLERLVLEMTEHAPVDDYCALRQALDPLRKAGLRLAIDDAGAGYASLQHIVQLAPDIIKLDMSLTRNVDSDPARRALTAALIFFGHETGASILAEGIETAGELAMLETLGIGEGQGYLLGRPAPLEASLEMESVTSGLIGDEPQATRKSAS